MVGRFPSGEGMSSEAQPNRGSGDDVNRRAPHLHRMAPRNQPRSSWIEGAGIQGCERTELTWAEERDNQRQDTRASARTIPKWAWIVTGLVVAGAVLRACA
jgi:hypothetical protein